MKQTCKIDSKCDRGPALQGLCPDKNKMIETNTVPDTSAEVIYNQLDDIEQVGFRISDTFDAIMMQRSISAGANIRKGSSKVGSQEASSSVSVGEAPDAPKAQ